ncbi:hypothetical protein D3C86_1587460 [compost metagenome]
MVHVADALHLPGNRGQRSPGTLAGLDTRAGRGLPGMHRRHRILRTLLEAADHLLDFIGRCLRTPRQSPHFIGHHGKPAPHVPGSRRFDSGVERQQVGLLGNPPNHRQHLVDRRHLMGQFTHRCGRNADFVRHAFDMADRATHHFPCLHRLIPSRL